MRNTIFYMLMVCFVISNIMFVTPLNASNEKTVKVNNIPNWLQVLKVNPVIPGSSFAKINIGDDFNKVTDVLGEPSKIYPADKIISFHSLIYKYKGIMLGIYIDADSNQVNGFRMRDIDFNNSRHLPYLKKQDKKISVGSSSSDLFSTFGNPVKKSKHNTCPGEVATFTYGYPGISFMVCTDNDKVYIIDIKKK